MAIISFGSERSTHPHLNHEIPLHITEEMGTVQMLVRHIEPVALAGYVVVPRLVFDELGAALAFDGCEIDEEDGPAPVLAQAC